MDQTFTVAFSDKDTELALKEISVKIKSVFPRAIEHLLVLFTPHYQTGALRKSLSFLLNPQSTLGFMCPTLIFEEKIVTKGIIVCCLNRAQMTMKSTVIESDTMQLIEASLKTSRQKLPPDKYQLYTYLGSHYNPKQFIQAVELSLGRSFPVLGVGFLQSFAAKEAHIVNETTKEGIIATFMNATGSAPIRICGFKPIGKPFTITRAILAKGIIMEINHQPALSIYQHYLGVSLPLFQKKRLFPLYPLGINVNGHYRLLTVNKDLDDGSLFCTGDIQLNKPTHIMIFDQSHVRKTLANTLPSRQRPGIGFIISSHIRNRILREHAQRELALIKKYMPLHTFFGICCDYTVLTDPVLQEPTLETGTLMISLLE